MKRVLVFLAAMSFGAGSLWASPSVSDAGFYPCTDPFSITLTSYSWTRVPSTNCAGRTLISLVNRSANTGDFVGIMTMTSDTPSIATGTVSIQIPKGTVDRGYPFDQGTYLWMRTTHTASETITGQELIQR